MPSRAVASRGAQIAVDVDSDSPVSVILCHGGPGGPDDFAALRAMLRARGITSARYDQRGVHRSTNDDGRWGPDAHADDLEAVRAAVGEDRVVAIGHSWGGVVARAWAKANPSRVRGLLLLSPSAAIGSEWRLMEKEVLATVRRGLVTRDWIRLGMWSVLATMPFVGDRAMGRVYRLVLRAYTGTDDTPEWVRHSSSRAAHLTRKAIRAVDGRMLDHLGLPPGVPLRMVFGDRDIYGPWAARCAERTEGAEVAFLRDCGHVLWHDQPAAFEAWLDEGLRACGLLRAEPSSI